jgi:hypothetical protein
VIELFRNNLFFNSLLLLPYTALIRIRSLLIPESYVPLENDSPLAKLFFEVIGTNPLVQSIIAILLIFIQAVLINRICIKHRLTHELTLFPGVFFVIWVSLFPELLVLSPALIANSFLIFAFYELFRTYKKPKASTHIFNVGFWISIAAIFYLPFISLILLGYVGIYTLRSFKWSERFQYITGIIVPFFWLGVWQLWVGNLRGVWQDFILENIQFFESITRVLSGNLAWVLGILVLLISFVFSYNQFTIKKSIQVQKKIDVYYWLMLCALVGLILINTPTHVYLIVLSLAVALFLSMYFLRVKNKMYGELIHIILIGIMYSMHFNLL